MNSSSRERIKVYLVQNRSELEGINHTTEVHLLHKDAGTRPLIRTMDTPVFFFFFLSSKRISK